MLADNYTQEQLLFAYVRQLIETAFCDGYSAGANSEYFGPEAGTYEQNLQDSDTMKRCAEVVEKLKLTIGLHH